MSESPPRTFFSYTLPTHTHNILCLSLSPTHTQTHTPSVVTFCFPPIPFYHLLLHRPSPLLYSPTLLFSTLQSRLCPRGRSTVMIALSLLYYLSWPNTSGYYPNSTVWWNILKCDFCHIIIIICWRRPWDTVKRLIETILLMHFVDWLQFLCISANNSCDLRHNFFF